MKIRTIIVDDEPLARQRVRMLLEEEPDVELLAECRDGFEAVDRIRETNPDLVFLDVQMPEMDGFQVLRQLPQAALPVVIFTTAYDRHALQAFEVNAVDYLLKPFKPTRFKESIQRARDLISDKRAGSAARGLIALLNQSPATGLEKGRLTRLAVKSTSGVGFVELASIQAIEAAGKYVVVHAGLENHILRETMHSLESRLPPHRFLRISRSVIVNKDHIRELQPMFKGENLVVMKDGKRYATTRPIREIQQKLEFG